MNSTETGRSVTCSGVLMSVNGIRTTPAIGITAIAVTAGMAITNGAIMKTTFSAFFGVKSSLNMSFMPSASDCSSPNGPFIVGPLRCCISPTTRRSNQMVNSVMHQQEDQGEDRLDQHQPPRVVRRTRPGRSCHHLTAGRSDQDGVAGGRREVLGDVVTRAAGSGSQTTPRTISTASWTGSVTEPRSLRDA